MQLGAQIRAARERRGWSQNELASRAKVKQPTLNRIESGKRNPSFDMVFLLAEALEVSIDSLVQSAVDEQGVTVDEPPDDEDSPTQPDRPATLEKRVALLERSLLEVAQAAREALALAQRHEVALLRRRKPSNAS